MKKSLVLLLIALFFDVNMSKNFIEIYLLKNKDFIEILLSLTAIVISITVYKDNKKNEEIKVMPMFEISLTKDEILSNNRLNIFKNIQINEKDFCLTPSNINHGYYKQRIKIKLKNKGAGVSFNTKLKKLTITSLANNLACKNLNIDLNLGTKKIIKIVNQENSIYIDLFISIKDCEYEKLKEFTIDEIKDYTGGIQVDIIGEVEFQDLYLNTYLQKFNLKDISFTLLSEELTHYNIDYNLPPIKL